MKKFSFIILLFTFSFLFFNLSQASAQERTVTNCDLCGWCGTDPGQRPADWQSCMVCLFPAFSASKNITITTSNPGKPTVPENETNYPSHPEVAKNWTVFGCLDTGAGGFVSQIYELIIAFGSGFAFLGIVYGGFKVLTASGDPMQISAGKHIIMGAISGILLIVFSIFLLRLVGVEIIKLPGFS